MSPAQGVSREAGLGRVFLAPTRILSLLFPFGSLCFALLLGLQGAEFAPDAAQYRLLALGLRGSVPAPFSARILGPAIAGFFARFTGVGVDHGFRLLGICCLIALLALVSRLLWATRAPWPIFAAVFLMPFWVDIFHDYYLPDLLHATFLAAILLCLFCGQTGLALLLLFPAYLARESTLLVAVCLLFACWRRVRLRYAVVGFLAVVSAAFISRQYARGGPISVHGLSGGTYILGKLIWSFFKNALGLPLWSNTLPECHPIWVMTLPHGYHLGAIHMIGVCPPAAWGPARLLLAWFGIFGVGPAFAVALWRRIFPPAFAGPLWRPTAPSSPAREEREAVLEWAPGLVICLRFSILYGLISIAMTPLLGASVDRLVEYGWPFYFVALPFFVARAYQFSPLRTAAVLLLHLITCWVAWFGFRQQANDGYLVAAFSVIALNGFTYGVVRRFQPGDPIVDSAGVC